MSIDTFFIITGNVFIGDEMVKGFRLGPYVTREEAEHMIVWLPDMLLVFFNVWDLAGHPFQAKLAEYVVNGDEFEHLFDVADITGTVPEETSI